MMQSVGQLLRQTRESQGYSVKQISNTLKIRESLIEALEEGNYTSFSSDMHLRGFLRSYATYLGIHEDRILALYRREREIKVDDGKSSTTQSGEKKTIKLFISKLFNITTLFSLISFVLLVLVLLFFYRQWTTFNTDPTLEVKSPVNNATITTDTFVIEGFTGDPSVKVILDGNEANYIDSLGNFRINAKFNEPGLKRFQIVARNQFNKQKEVQLDVTYKAPEKTPEKPKITIVSKSNNTLTIQTQTDKQTTFNPTQIKPKASVEFVIDEQINIKNLDKNNFDLFINNSQSPTNGLDFKDVTIIIQNNIPIIKEYKNPTPSASPTATPKK